MKYLKDLKYFLLLKHLLLFTIPLTWYCPCISQTRPPEKSSELQNTEPELIIQTLDGDKITTGKPFLWEGKSTSASQLPPPEVFSSETITIPADLPKEVPLTRSEVRHWPDDLPTIIPGQNGVPLPLDIALKPDTLTLPLPSRIEARPFQRKSLSTSQLETLTMEEGLPFNVISSMFEDSKGHYWMGCDIGIIHFDGKEFLLYDFSKLATIFNIHALMEDSQGNLWFGLFNYGLTNSEQRDAIAKFDGQHLLLYNFAELDQYSSHIDKEQNLRNYDIIEDQNNRIWVASDFGLVQIKDDSCRLYTTEQGLQENTVYDLALNKSGLIWIIHPNGNTSFDGTQFIQYQHNLDLAKLYMGSSATAMDAKGAIWLFTYQMAHVFTKDSLVSFSTPFVNIGQESGVLADSLGFIWLGAKLTNKENFLAKLDPVRLSYTKYSEEEGLIDHFHYPLLSDSKGSLWLRSSVLGIQRFSPHKIQYKGFDGLLELNDVTGIIEDQAQNIWFGVHNTALIAGFDGKKYTFFEEFYSTYRYPFHARDIYLDQKDHLWIGVVEYGVIKWDKNQLLGYTPKHGLAGDEVYAITEDSNGSMWFGTREDGLTKYDGESFVEYKLDDGYKESERKQGRNIKTIRSLITDRDGNIWIGSYGGGLIKHDGEYTTIYTKKEGLSDNMVTSLLEDREGYIWVGTLNGGINRFNPKDSVLSFEIFDTEDGLSSNEIWTITEDSLGNIWLGVDRCQNLLLREAQDETGSSETSFRVIDYCNVDGKAGGEYYANSTYRDSKNRIWWGSSNTLQMLPSNVYPIQEPARVELTEINLAQTVIDFRKLADSIALGKSYLAGENKELDFANIDFESIAPFKNYPLGLKLPHYFNNVTFRFSASNHPRLDHVKFSYFIEGIDNNWSTPSKENKVEYRGLPPGNYKFQIKAAGLEGYWGPVFTYNFTIRPPWWRSTAAYLFWLLLIALWLYGLYNYNLRRQLEKAETRRVKELDHLKSRLYTNITHEFRTPLTVIMGMTEQLSENAAELPNTYKEKLSNGLGLIQRNGQNLLRLINQLLDLSKLDSGKLKLNMVQGDIVAYLQYLTESFYSMAEDKGIRLTFYSEEQTLIMDYDEEKLQHIVYNLLSNAIKFTPEKGKVIFHVLKKEGQADKLLEMKVIDTGVGMSSEELTHVFDRFYQADGSSTRKGEGTGIGLSLTKELVALLQGDILVESMPEKGTTFTIRLLINNDALLKDFIPSDTSVIPSHIPETTLHSEAVTRNTDAPILLIIEDNPDVVLYIKNLLEKQYTIHTAENGQIGIDRAIELVPDIIISDVMMPEKNGYEVCHTLKQDERTSHIPIILLTARATKEDRIEGLRYGADAYLTKPFQKKELMIRLEKLVEIRQKLQARFSDPNMTKAENIIAPVNDSENLFLEKLREKVKAHLDNPDFGVPQLAESLFMSQMQVYRKLKALTGKTPSQFIRSIRLQKGKELLQTTDMTISEIAYEVGFSDPNYFSRTFQTEFNAPPRDLRK